MREFVSHKAAQFKESVIREMSRVAAKHKAVNLAQGFPDFPAPPEIKDAACRAIMNNHNQYAITWGTKSLRDGIVAKTLRDYGVQLDPETNLTVCCGATEGMIASLMATVNPGEEVVVFEPFYENYGPDAILCGATPRFVSLNPPEFSFDRAELAAAFNDKTRAIIINSPHNPTGTILQDDDIAALQQLVQQHPLYIISDEVYEHLVFDQQPHRSILAHPVLRARAFVCFSFGKTYHCTGWKIGYAVAPPALSNLFRKLHQFNCFSCHTPVQVALATYLQQQEAYLELGKTMQAKRDYFLSLLQNSRFDFLHSSGSYFICARYHRINDWNDAAFAEWLTRQHGVATIPLSAFYQQKTDSKLIRFCFAKADSTLELAAKKLCAV